MSIVHLRHWSGSHALVVPKLFLDALGLEKGAYFQVIATESGFLYVPMSPILKERFKALFSDSVVTTAPEETVG